MSPKCLRGFTVHFLSLSLSLSHLLTECSTSLFSKLGSSKAAKSGFKLLSYHSARLFLCISIYFVFTANLCITLSQRLCCMYVCIAWHNLIGWFAYTRTQVFVCTAHLVSVCNVVLLSWQSSRHCYSCGQSFAPLFSSHPLSATVVRD